MKDLAVLFASPAGLIFLLAHSLVLGWSVWSSAGTYGTLGAVIGDGTIPKTGLSPISDLFMPAFRPVYRYLALLLPVVVTGLLRGRAGHAEPNFIGQQSRMALVVCAKFFAGIVYLITLVILSFPALYYWHMLGGSISAGEMLPIYAGYFLYGSLILAVSIFFASLIQSRAVASCAAMAAMLLPHFLDFIRESTGADYTCGMPVPHRIMDHFEQGIASPFATACFIGLISFALACSAVVLVRGRTIRMRSAAVLLVTAAMLWLAGRSPDVSVFLTSNLDISFGHGVSAVSSVMASTESLVDADMQPAASGWQSGNDAAGSLLLASQSDFRGMLAVYWGIIPLLILLACGVRAVRASGMEHGKKGVIIMVATWAVLIIACALVQDFYFKNRSWKIFPSVREVLPRWMGKAEQMIGSGTTAAGSSVSVEHPAAVHDPNYIYAGEDYQNLKRFFKKLSDLKAGRRSTVRIVHYGDSLIWGDCFSRTMKRRFQKDFGDGGRGVVPPVESMSTTLQDHINRSSPDWFSRHELRHEFRSNGSFCARPGLSTLVGFTGEGSFIRSPLAEIRMEIPPGSEKCRRIQVYLRPPLNSAMESAETHIRLAHDAGTMERVLIPTGTGPHAVTFDVPPTGMIGISFDGSTGPLPSVDALNLETGSGVVYSAVVRMGIHMAWLNAVPDRYFTALREIAPDLLIFQFGVNEAASLDSFSEFTEEMMRAQVREWLGKLKRLLPGTDVLIVGPPERLQSVQGTLIPMEETMAVRRIQREEALRAGMAFFDTYELLGGPGQMLKMVGSGLAMDDYTHFTVRGGDTAAGGMYDSIMNVFMKRNGRPAIDLREGERQAIIFNSASYAYFLFVTIIVVMLIGKRATVRYVFLAGASYYFYATWNVWPVACLAMTTLTDYSMAILIYRARKRGGRGTGYLAASLGVDLGILFALKYFDFFSDLAGKAINLLGYQASVPILNILLPVGISFYTFQSLSYTIDVWRGAMKPTGSLVKYAHYVSLFTQLLAGPIVRAREFLPALKNGVGHFVVTQGHFTTALFLILAGLIKKAGADWLGAAIVDRVFAGPGMFTSIETLAAVYAYGLQIYGDFSGYSDIAIGSAMLLGYNLTENFRRPYASASVSEFWQRWHISLGNWLREYLYISLGGNRKRVLFNIGITMLLCGLWHGAALPFVMWGAYHGCIMIVERAFGLNRRGKSRPVLRGVRVFITLHIVLFGWIIFRADSWENFTAVMRSLVQLKGGAANVGALVACVMAMFYAAHYTPIAWKDRLKAVWADLPPAMQGLAAAGVTIFLYNIATADAVPFIYFRF